MRSLGLSHGFVVHLLAVLCCLAGCSADDSDEESNNNEEADDDADPADDDSSAVDDDNDNDSGDDDSADDDDNDDDDDDCTPLPDGVYVAKVGDNANPGTPDAPMKTIAAGLAAAQAQGLPVFVAKGVYDESLSVAGELRGGYRFPDWARDIAAFPTQIESAEPHVVTMMSAPSGETLLEGFIVLARPPEAADAIAAVLVESGPARVAANTIRHGIGPLPSTAEAHGVAIVAGETVIVENNAIDGQGAISPEQQGWAAGASVLEGATDVTLRANTITAGPCAAPLAAVSAGIFVDAPDAQVLLAGNRAAGALGVSSLVGFSDGVEIARGTVTLVGNVLVGGLAFGVTGMAISAGVHTSDAAEPPLLVNNTARGGFAMWVVAAAEFETGATLVNNVFIVETGMAEEVGVLARGGFGLFWLHHNDIWCRDPAHCSLFGVRDASGDGFEIKDIDALNRCAWDYCMAAEDNIAADPLLAGANDFHLQTDSPCIDAGTDPTAWFDGPDAYRDFDGDPRPLGGDWDIGADEAH